MLTWSALKRFNAELFRTIGVFGVVSSPVTAGVIHLSNRLAAAYGLELSLGVPLGVWCVYASSILLLSAQILITLFGPWQALRFGSGLERSAFWISSLDALRASRAKVEELFAQRLADAAQQTPTGAKFSEDDLNGEIQRMAKAAANSVTQSFPGIETEIAGEISTDWSNINRSKRDFWLRAIISVLLGFSFLGFAFSVYFLGPRTMLGIGT